MFSIKNNVILVKWVEAPPPFWTSIFWPLPFFELHIWATLYWNTSGDARHRTEMSYFTLTDALTVWTVDAYTYET